MKTTNSPPRMTGVSLSQVELTVGGAGDMSMKAKANLVSDDGAIHGMTERVGGWSDNVTEAVRGLIDALEEHLLAAHFELSEGEEYGNEHTPKGILDA